MLIFLLNALVLLRAMKLIRGTSIYRLADMLLPISHIGAYILAVESTIDAVGWVGGGALNLQEQPRNVYYYSGRKLLKKVCILHSQVKTPTSLLLSVSVG